ncbi:MAG: amidase family protein [Proteobacteria bacterium]|nr:amidase family protein [Pseudomonadota bacterium]
MEPLTLWQNLLRDTERKTTWAQALAKRDAVIRSLLEFHPDGDGDTPHSDGDLPGIPFAVDSRIAAEGFRLTCASRMLADFVAPYSATAVERLQHRGARVVATGNADAFGMGASTENAATSVTRNPWNTDCVAGGASGGAAAAVASGLVPFALAADTGGGLRQPASLCGCLGLRPTYGAVSRHGLAAHASSMDTIGVLARDIATLRRVYECIAGPDERDPTTAPPTPLAGSAQRVGVLDDLSDLSAPVAQNYRDTVAALRDLGIETRPVALPLLPHAVATYHIIAAAEASTSLARYTGVSYGFRQPDTATPEEMIRQTRSLGFNDENKLRILLGTHALRAENYPRYIARATQARAAIRHGMADLFRDVDLILTPTYPTQAFPLGTDAPHSVERKHADRYTILPSLAGLPAAAFPTGTANDLPLGLQLIAPPFGEARLFDALGRILGDAPCPLPPTMTALGGQP